MTSSAMEYGPDNPRDWDPNHRSLNSPFTPHESAAILRMYRAGVEKSKIMKLLKLRGTQMMKAMERAMDCEGIASRSGVPIHDAKVPKGTV